MLKFKKMLSIVLFIIMIICNTLPSFANDNNLVDAEIESEIVAKSDIDNEDIKEKVVIEPSLDGNNEIVIYDDFEKEDIKKIRLKDESENLLEFDSESEHESEYEIEPEKEKESEPDIELESESEHESESEIEPEIEKESEPDIELESESENESEYEIELEIEKESEPEIEFESESENESESEIEFELENESELEIENKSEIELEYEFKSDEAKKDDELIDIIDKTEIKNIIDETIVGKITDITNENEIEKETEKIQNTTSAIEKKEESIADIDDVKNQIVLNNDIYGDNVIGMWYYLTDDGTILHCTGIEPDASFNASFTKGLMSNIRTNDRNKILKIIFHDAIELERTSSLFFNYKSVTQIENLNYLDTSNVTTMQNMFNGCYSLTSLDLSNFNTSNVTRMDQMFLHCNNLTSIDVSGFDTSNVTNMNSMFGECLSLKNLDIDNFDTSKVTIMAAMFSECAQIKNLDISNFDTSSVTNMNYMFHECSSLNTIYVSDKFDVSNVTSSDKMFQNCISLVGENGTVYDETYIDKTYACVDTTATPGYFTFKGESKPTLTSITVNTPPTKVDYNVGEKFNPDGLKINKNYSDGSDEVVTYEEAIANEFIFSPNATLTNADTSITITYAEKSCTQNITIKELTKLIVAAKPTKLDYTSGQKLDPAGLCLLAEYTIYDITGNTNITENVEYNNTTKNDFTFNPSLTTNLSKSHTSVSVSYGGKSTSFSITVSKNSDEPTGGGGSTSGSGGGRGGISYGINSLHNIPAMTKISENKNIKATINFVDCTWVEYPIISKWKLYITLSNGQVVHLSNGFYQVNNITYQSINNGEKQVNNIYYFDSEGYMVTGWIQTADSKWYFFENAKTIEEGKMSIGWKQIQGFWYYFTLDGSMLTNAVTPDGYLVGADGKWIK